MWNVLRDPIVDLVIYIIMWLTVAFHFGGVKGGGVISLFGVAFGGKEVKSGQIYKVQTIDKSGAVIIP